MNLIAKFESMPFQDVGTFNSIFKNTPILGFPFSSQVEIRGIVAGERRNILVGDTTVELDLTQGKNARDFQQPYVRRFENKVKPAKVVKVKPVLPIIYKQLTGTEFLIYSAVKELGEVHGITELSRHISLTTKSIYNNLPRLEKLGYVKTERAISESGDYTKISVDTSV